MDVHKKRTMFKASSGRSTETLIACALCFLLLLLPILAYAYDPPFTADTGEGSNVPETPIWARRTTSDPLAYLLMDWDGDGQVAAWEFGIFIGMLAAAAIGTYGAVTKASWSVFRAPQFVRASSMGSRLLNLKTLLPRLLQAEVINKYVQGRFISYNSMNGIRPSGGVFNEYTYGIFNERLTPFQRASGAVWWVADDALWMTGFEFWGGGLKMARREVMIRLGKTFSKEALPASGWGLRSLKVFLNTLRTGTVSKMPLTRAAILESYRSIQLGQMAWNAGRVGHICATFNIPLSTVMYGISYRRLPTMEEYMSMYTEGGRMGVVFGGIMEFTGPILRPLLTNAPKVNRVTLIAPESFGAEADAYFARNQFTGRIFSSVMEEMVREEAVGGPMSFLNGLSGGRFVGMDGWGADGKMVGWGELVQESFDPFGKPINTPSVFGLLGKALGNMAFGGAQLSGVEQAQMNEFYAGQPVTVETYEIRGFLKNAGIRADAATEIKIGKILSYYQANGYSPAEALDLVVSQGIKQNRIELAQMSSSSYTAQYKASPISVIEQANMFLSGQNAGINAPAITGASVSSFISGIPASFNLAEFTVAAGPLYQPASVDVPFITAMHNSGMTASEIGMLYNSAGPGVHYTEANIPAINSMKAQGLSTAQIGEFFSGAGAGITLAEANIPAIKQMQVSGMSMKDIGSLYSQIGNARITGADVPVLTGLATQKVSISDIGMLLSSGFSSSEVGAFYATAGASIPITPADLPAIQTLHSSGYTMSEIGSFYNGAGTMHKVTSVDLPKINALNKFMSMQDIGTIYGQSGTLAHIPDAQITVIKSMHSGGFTALQIGEFYSATGASVQVSKADIATIKQLGAEGISMRDIGRLYDLQEIGKARKISLSGILQTQNLNINSGNAAEIASLLNTMGVSVKDVGIMLNAGLTAQDIKTFYTSSGNLLHVDKTDASAIKTLSGEVSLRDLGSFWTAFQKNSGRTAHMNYEEATIAAPRIRDLRGSGVSMEDIAAFYGNARQSFPVLGNRDLPTAVKAIELLGAETAANIFTSSPIDYESNLNAAIEMQGVTGPEVAKAAISSMGENAFSAHKSGFLKTLVDDVGPAAAGRLLSEAGVEVQTAYQTNWDTKQAVIKLVSSIGAEDTGKAISYIAKTEDLKMGLGDGLTQLSQLSDKNDRTVDIINSVGLENVISFIDSTIDAVSQLAGASVEDASALIMGMPVAAAAKKARDLQKKAMEATAPDGSLSADSLESMLSDAARMWPAAMEPKAEMARAQMRDAAAIASDAAFDAQALQGDVEKYASDILCDLFGLKGKVDGKFIKDLIKDIEYIENARAWGSSHNNHTGRGRIYRPAQNPNASTEEKIAYVYAYFHELTHVVERALSNRLASGPGMQAITLATRIGDGFAMIFPSLMAEQMAQTTGNAWYTALSKVPEIAYMQDELNLGGIDAGYYSKHQVLMRLAKDAGGMEKIAGRLFDARQTEEEPVSESGLDLLSAEDIYGLQAVSVNPAYSGGTSDASKVALNFDLETMRRLVITLAYSPSDSAADAAASLMSRIKPGSIHEAVEKVELYASPGSSSI